MSKLVLLASAVVLGTTLLTAPPQAEAHGGGGLHGGGVHGGSGGFHGGFGGHAGFRGFHGGFGVRAYGGYAGGWGWRAPRWGYYAVPACYPYCGFVVVR